MRRQTIQTTATGLALAGLIVVALLITAQTPDRGKPLAEVDGKVITARELRKALGRELADLEEQIYNLKQQKLDELIAEKLLTAEAAKRGLSVEALLEAEVTAKVEPATDEEIETLYIVTKGRFQGDEEALRERIQDYLRNKTLAARRQAFVELLRSQANVVIHLAPLEVYRAEVGVEGAPFRGTKTAPVTVVKFEDFHCPYCSRVQSTLRELLDRYDGKIKIVHRDFPLDNVHPGARQAHEAARCAAEQGEFWAYHDMLFANGPKSSPEQFKAYARELGLDVPAFEECLASGDHQTAVQKDIDEGFALGLSGTPSFFINGRELSGALPLEDFVQIIEEELAPAP